MERHCEVRLLTPNNYEAFHAEAISSMEIDYQLEDYRHEILPKQELLALASRNGVVSLIPTLLQKEKDAPWKSSRE